MSHTGSHKPAATVAGIYDFRWLDPQQATFSPRRDPSVICPLGLSTSFSPLDGLEGKHPWEGLRVSRRTLPGSEFLSCPLF